MGIPKTIHYCWFGNSEKSDTIKKCLCSWKKYAPDYKIVEWNEKNFDINMFKYARQAYEKKKYAFVADVARFYILNKVGGIYLDTDVEMIKPIDELLGSNMFMAYARDGKINAGLIMGAEKNQNILQDILQYYRSHNFLLKNGRPNTTTVVTIVSDILKSKGIELNGKKYVSEQITLYPKEFFDPYDYESKKMYLTKDAYTIHYYTATWKSKNDRIINKIGKIIKRVTGRKLYEKIARLKHRIVG